MQVVPSTNLRLVIVTKFNFTPNLQVELEAIALSKLGTVYRKVLKMPQRAKENYMRCVQLAMSLHPRTFDDDG